MDFQTVRWEDGVVVLLDQTKLPEEEIYLRCESTADLIAAIRRLSVRGAPAIGVAGAYGAALAAHRIAESDGATFRARLATELDALRVARPTAVNLSWAIDRVRRIVDGLATASVDEIRAALLTEAQRIDRQDRESCLALGRLGAELIPDGSTVLTHCNAGALATAGRGTALAVVYAAHEAGKKVQVFSDETRPLLQGARLTAWECQRMGVPVTLLCDNAAGWILAQGKVDRIVVGADRIAANGDVANKIGTYMTALAARHHGVGFMVAAPTSTIDAGSPSGDAIPIEQRPATEVLAFGGRRVAPEGVAAWNPVFDITPATLVDVLVTERGVVRSPDAGKIAALMKKPR